MAFIWMNWTFDLCNLGLSLQYACSGEELFLFEKSSEYLEEGSLNIDGTFKSSWNFSLGENNKHLYVDINSNAYVYWEMFIEST